VGEEGNKREGESCWKSGGGRVRLYTWRRAGLADEARSDTIPDVAGGEGGHGAAKPEGVIHRYLFNFWFLIKPKEVGQKFRVRPKSTP